MLPAFVLAIVTPAWAGTFRFHLDTRADFVEDRAVLDLGLRLEATEAVGPTHVSLFHEGKEHPLGHVESIPSGQSQRFRAALSGPTLRREGTHLFPMRIRWLSQAGQHYTNLVVAQASRGAPPSFEAELLADPLTVTGLEESQGTLRIHNRSVVSRSIRLSSVTPDGLTVSLSTSSLEIPAGQSREVTLHVKLTEIPPSGTYDTLILARYESESRVAAGSTIWTIRIAPMRRPGDWLFSEPVSQRIFVLLLFGLCAATAVPLFIQRRSC